MTAAPASMSAPQATPASSTPTAARAASQDAVAALLADSQVAAEVAAIRDRESDTIALQVELTEIPSPTFAEGRRAQRFAELLAERGVHDVTIDPHGNVLGHLGPRTPGVLLTAHLDTVFDADTDVSVHRDDDGVYHGAGIVDDDRGLAAVLSTAQSLARVEGRLRTGVLIGANVREEGKGNLGGAQFLLEDHGDEFHQFITVDGADPARIVSAGTACKSYVARFTGPGGHAFGDAGRVSAVHAAARAVVAIADIEVPADPKTIRNVGAMRGGVTETSIAYDATIEIDLRSNDPAALDALDGRMHAAVARAVAEENARADTSAGEIAVDVRQTCDIPGGTIPDDDPLVATAAAAFAALGLDVRTGISVTTDANIMLSVGRPAVCLGGGGDGGNEHSTEEYYDPTNSHLGPQGVFLTVLGLVGLR
jgi:acetylornithine deacetylase/succinyl-diaminopimelate desuccinylase-like protein